MRILFFLIYWTTGFVFNQANTQNNTLDWKSILKQSKKTNKAILIDFYFTGCPPCAKLKKEVFQDQELYKKITDKYLVYFYNRDEENGKLKRKLNISSYPTIIVMDHEKNVLKRFSGYGGKDAFIENLFTAAGNFREFKLPEEYKNYKSDTLVLKQAVQYLYDNNFDYPDRKTGLTDENIEDIYYKYFTNVKTQDSVFTKIVTYQLLHIKECQEWLVNNMDFVKLYIPKERGKFYINRALEYYYKRPREIKNWEEQFERNKYITAALTEYHSGDEEFYDSLYHTLSFIDTKVYFRLKTVFKKGKYKYLDEFKEEVFFNLIQYQTHDKYIFDEILNYACELSIRYDCTQKLQNLFNSIENNPSYKNFPNLMEVQAICLYRMNRKEEAVEKMRLARIKANELESPFKFIIHELKAKKKLSPVNDECSRFKPKKPKFKVRHYLDTY